MSAAGSTKARQGTLVLPDFCLSPLAELRAVSSRLNGTLSLLLGVDALQLPAYEAMSRPHAVLTYPEVSLAWLVAVALDVLPLVLLVILVMIGRMQAPATGRSPEGTDLAYRGARESRRSSARAMLLS